MFGTESRLTRGAPRWLLVLLVAALVQATLALWFGWVGDDAHIAFRYARNLADGFGLRFNPSDDPPTEGYTQLAWVLVVAVVERFDLPVIATTRALEIATGLGLLVLVTLRARARGGVVGACAAATFFATSPGIVVWSSGGLGTLLFATTVFLVVDRALVASDRVRFVTVAAAAVAVTLARFDGIWFVGWALIALFVAGLRTGSRPLRRVAVAATVVAVLAVAAQALWRLAYYDDWLPNTARAKVTVEPWVLGRGALCVLANYANVPALALATLLTVVMGTGRRWRSSDAWPTAAAIVVLATIAYCVAVGGDFMAMGRFLVPSLPFAAVALGDLAAAVARRRGALVASAVVGAFTSLSLPTLFGAVYLPLSLRHAIDFRYGLDYQTEIEFLRGDRDRARYWTNIGRALALHTQPSESLVRGTIGAVGYYSNLTLYDQYGLVDREVALHWPRDPQRRAHPGHDVFADATFFADRKPDYVHAEIRFGIVEGDPEYQAFLGDPLYATGKVLLFQLRVEDGFDDAGTLVLIRY